MAQVALVQMPYAVTSLPSLGLSLLKAGLQKQEITATVLYLNQWFEQTVGHSTYQYMASGSPNNSCLLSEWTFTEALWGENHERDEAYFKEIIDRQDGRYGRTLSDAERAEARTLAALCRESVAAFLDRSLREIDWNQFRIVGFTSVFQQHSASLALARLLKRHHPHLFLVFGGANCEAEMGEATMRCFPFIDAICFGEGDEVFPRFTKGVLAGAIEKMEGILLREEQAQNRLDVIGQPVKGASPIRDLDSLPYPDFDDFFSVKSESDAPLQRRLIFETSRGCWWGQKHHCTFCGLNGNGMEFRYKSPSRALEELQWLLARYGSHTRSITATDNILPYEYFRSFLPRLADLAMNIDLFYETKANLKRTQLELYKRAGLSEIQPGIESLSTQVLSLIDKGVTAIQNIQLLKFCYELNIIPRWNILYGFPKEDPRWYLGQTELICKIVHLHPPNGWGRVRFDRFSPFLNNPFKFAIRNVSPYPSYRFVYPGLTDRDLNDIAYYFTASSDSDSRIREYSDSISESLQKWKALSGESFLFHHHDQDVTLIYDSRDGNDVHVFTLEGIYNAISILSEEIISCEELERKTIQINHEWASEVSFDQALHDLEEIGLLIIEDGKALGLSVALESATPLTPKMREKFENMLAKQAVNCSDGQ
jgi:ribosomal peptide maturation radical SAM protein 1